MKEIELFPCKIRKHPRARVAALYYPGTYQESLLNLGYQAVYSMIRESEYWHCERFFYSFKQGTQGVDHGGDLCDTDPIFVTLGWEPHVFSLLDTLSKCRIMNKSSRDIPIISGGILVDTPGCKEVLNDFIDYFYVGEAEAGFDSLLQMLFSNSDYRQVFSDDQAHQMYDMSVTRSYSKILCPDTDTHFKSSFLISIMRGCLNPCRFCLLGSRKGRTVFLQPEVFRNILQPVINRKDVKSVGLVGTSPTENPYFTSYLDYIIKHQKKIGFSSLRIGSSINEPLIPYLKHSSHKTLTFAPDALTDRLGKMIQKNVPFSNLKAMTIMLYSEGFRDFKFYYMIGLPGEKDQDVEEFTSQIRELLSIGSDIHLKLSFSHFVPKSGTDMCDSEFMPRKVIKKRVRIIRKKLRLADIKVESNSDTVIQAAFSKIPATLIQELFDHDAAHFRLPDRSDIMRFERIIT